MDAVDRDELVFTFPDVHESAVLRVQFRRADPPEDTVHLARRSGSFAVATRGRLILRLLPNVYPFAVVVTVRGRNALTGDASNARLARPQNYFVTPPQGGIDAYFADGRVHPLLACDGAANDRIPLDLKVFPMKAEAFTYLQNKRSLIPGPAPWGSHFTLSYGGERQCEPVYEDTCCLGDWDQGQGKQATVWLQGRS